MQTSILTFRFSPFICKLWAPVFKFFVSGTHQFDVSMSICVTPGHVLGLLFWILWLVYRFTGNPGQSWVPLVMKQHHQSIAYTSKSPSANRSISQLYMQVQVHMNGHLAGITVSSASSSPLTCEMTWLSFSCLPVYVCNSLQLGSAFSLLG